jgi:hypothetical protein
MTKVHFHQRQNKSFFSGIGIEIFIKAILCPIFYCPVDYGNMSTEQKMSMVF